MERQSTPIENFKNKVLKAAADNLKRPLTEAERSRIEEDIAAKSHILSRTPDHPPYAAVILSLFPRIYLRDLYQFVPEFDLDFVVHNWIEFFSIIKTNLNITAYNFFGLFFVSRSVNIPSSIISQINYNVQCRGGNE